MPPKPSVASLPTQAVQILKTHSQPVNTIAFSSQTGTYILTGSSDRQIHLSRTEPSSAVETTTPIQKYTSHGYAVLSVCVSQSNNTFASSGGDRSIFLWDIHVADSTVRRLGSNTSQGHTSRITSVSYAAADDAVLVSGSDDRSVRIWDLKGRDGRPVQVLDEAKDGISNVVTVGYDILAGSVDGRVRCYDIRMGRVVVDVQPGAVTCLDVARDDEKVMLVGCLDGRLRLMDRQDGKCLRTFPTEKESGYKNDSLRLQSCLGAHGGLVVSGSESDGCIRAWDVVSGDLVGKVKVSESGKVVSVVKWREASEAQKSRAVWAAGGADGMVRVYGE